MPGSVASGTPCIIDINFYSSTHKINFPKLSACFIFHNKDDKFLHSMWERLSAVQFRIFHILMSCLRTDRDSSVGIATRYGLEGLGIEFRWGRDFPHPFRPAYRVFPGGKAASAWL